MYETARGREEHAQVLFICFFFFVSRGEGRDVIATGRSWEKRLVFAPTAFTIYTYNIINCSRERAGGGGFIIIITVSSMTAHKYERVCMCVCVYKRPLLYVALVCVCVCARARFVSHQWPASVAIFDHTHKQRRLYNIIICRSSIPWEKSRPCAYAIIVPRPARE